MNRFIDVTKLIADNMSTIKAIYVDIYDGDIYDAGLDMFKIAIQIVNLFYLIVMMSYFGKTTTITDVRASIIFLLIGIFVNVYILSNRYVKYQCKNKKKISK